jgi:glucokinase
MKAAIRSRHADGTIGEAEHAVRRPTPPDETAADALAAFAATLIARHGPVDAVGLAIPGIVDDAAGMAEFSVAPTWSALPMREAMASRLGVPVALGHDTRIGGLAEGRAGAAVGCRDYLFVTLGTGVGGMLCLDGAPRLGPHHRAGELGHLVVDPLGVECGCGRRGCLETIASAPAIARLYGGAVSAREVAARAAAGEPRASDVWHMAASALAKALESAITLLAQAGELLLEPVRRELAERITFQCVPEIVCAALGDDAAVLGAALIAFDLMGES